MYWLDIIRRSARNLKQAKARTLLTALAIGVGSFALALTLAASNGAQHFVNQVISDNFDPAELIVTNDEAVFANTSGSTPKEYDDTYGRIVGGNTQIKRLTDADIEKLKTTAGVEQVREGIMLDLLYMTRPGQKRYIATVQSYSPAQNPELKAGAIPKPLQNRGVILPEAYLSVLGFKSAEDAIGKPIILAVRKPIDQEKVQALLKSGAASTSSIQQLATNSSEEQQFTVVAVSKKPTTSQPGTELNLYIGGEDAKAINDTATKGTADYHKYTYAFVRVKNGEDKATLKAVQDKIKKIGYSAQSVEDTQKFLTKIISVLQGIVVAFGAIAVIASVFGIINTMYISVLQRTREIGLMKALGMRRKDIGRLFRFEAAWIGFIGGVIGAVIAYLTCLVLNPWITQKLDLGTQKLLLYNFKDVAILVILLTIVSILAGWLPSRKAAKLDPIEALRTD